MIRAACCSRMKVTVCELPDERAAFEFEWLRLVEHMREAASELVLLPDMPFYPWFADSRRFDNAVWAAAMQAHDEWEHRLSELAPALVVSSRPIEFGNERYDEGFVWDAADGVRSVHAKTRFRDEDSETSWYRCTSPEFVPLEVRGARIGFLMDAEVAAEDEARRYGEEGVDLLAMPRGAGGTSFEEWLERARKDVVLARAYGLSSNRSGVFGGQGCIIAPDGDVLGLTSQTEPFLSLDLELAQEVSAESATPADASIDPLETGVPPYS